MKKQNWSRIITVLAFLVCMGITHYTFTYSSSNPPEGHTGAPGESSCTSCHSGSVITSGTEYDSIKLNLGRPKLEYIPDSTYHMELTFYANNQNKYGFQIVALYGSTNINAGSMTITNGVKTKKLTKAISPSIRQYVTHTSSGVIASNGFIKWEFDWTAPSKNIGDIRFYVALNNSNRNGSSSGDKIIEKVFTVKPSSELPVASIKSSVSSVCAGDTVEFYGSGTNNTTNYSWTFQNGTPSKSGSKDVKVVFNKSGTARVTLSVANSKGNSLNEVLNFNVKSSPSNAIDSSGALSFCQGDSVTLTSREGNSWKWSSGETSSSITIKKSGTYQVIATGSNGCTSTSLPLDVTVNTPVSPSLSLVSNDSLCEDETVELLADNRLTTFDLLRDGSKISAHSSPVLQLKPGAGNYLFTVQGIDSNGCASNKSLPVEVHLFQHLPAPKITCDSATADYLIVGWDSINQAAGYEISIDSGKTWTLPSFADGSNRHKVDGLTFSTVVDFRIRAIDKGPCQLSFEGHQVCKTSPCFKVRYDLLLDDTLCTGDSLKAKISNLNLSKYSVSFNKGAYSDALDFQKNMVSSENLIISFIDSFSLSCPSEDTSIAIRVFDYPQPQVANNWPTRISNNNHICANDILLELSTSLTDSSGFSTTWHGPGVMDLGNGQYRFIAKDAGTDFAHIYAIVDNEGGCETRVNDSVMLDNPPEVQMTTEVRNGGRVLFTATDKNANRRTWDFGDGQTDTARTVEHIYDTSGIYRVSVTVGYDPSACYDASSAKDIFVIGASVERTPINAISIFPTPANDVLYIQWSQNISQETQVVLFNTSGRRVLSQTLGNGTLTTLNLDQLQSGTYIVQIIGQESVIQKMVIKQ